MELKNSLSNSGNFLPTAPRMVEGQSFAATPGESAGAVGTDKLRQPHRKHNGYPPGSD
jgi:hypothetical protein